MRILGVCMIASLLLAGCAHGTPPPPTTEEREIAALQPIFDKNKRDVLTGYDVKGTAFLISADAEKWSEQDEDAELALRARMLSAWKHTWSKYHPNKHAALTVLFRNYYGQEIVSEKARI